MTLGLSQTLTQLVLDFKTEYQATKFELALRNPPVPPLDHIYSAVYSSTVISKFSALIRDSMEEQTTQAINNTVKNFLIFVIFTILFNFFIAFYQKANESRVNLTIQRIIMLIPQLSFINSAHQLA